MKTLTITLHDTDNCGSSLQAYALQHFLIKNNVENEIIDYIPEYTKNNGNIIKFVLRRIIYYKSSKEKYIKFQAFKHKYLKVTSRRYTLFSELKDAHLKADCFIAGSDQLWNNMYQCGNDPAFYLEFAESPKIAYAVSMGRNIVPDDNRNQVIKYAQKFQWISFREQISVKQFKDYMNCPVDYVCDPVLLNPVTDYDLIKSKPIFHEPYILVYIAQAINRNLIDDLILNAKNMYLGKVVMIGTYRNKCNCDIHIKNTSPEEFLSLISNAQFVISNSFHATVFSMLYKRQFMTIIPPQNGERIKMILDIAGIPENAVYNEAKIHQISSDEYLTVEKNLYNFSSVSQNLIKKYLSKISEMNR